MVAVLTPNIYSVDRKNKVLKKAKPKILCAKPLWENLFIKYVKKNGIDLDIFDFDSSISGNSDPIIQNKKNKKNDSTFCVWGYNTKTVSPKSKPFIICVLYVIFKPLFFLSTEYIFGVNTATIASLGFFTGYISHIFGDMVTYSGLEFIPGFHRMKIGIFGSFKVGSTVELKIYNIYLVVQVFLFFVLFYRLYVIHGGQ